MLHPSCRRGHENTLWHGENGVHFGCLFMLILVRFLKGSRNLFKLRSNFSRSCFFFFGQEYTKSEFQSTMYEADAEIAGAAVAQVGQVGA